jgi:hypothetical protein
MTTDRLRRRVEAVVLRHPAGGWRAHARTQIEDWPDYALIDLIRERLDASVGAAVPPSLAQAAIGRLDFLFLLIARDRNGARRYLRQLA